jgi:hypothetical protein
MTIKYGMLYPLFSANCDSVDFEWFINEPDVFRRKAATDK